LHLLPLQLLNYYVTKLVHYASRPKRCTQALTAAAAANHGGDAEVDTEPPEETTFRSIHEYLRATAALDDLVFACCSDDPVEDLETMKYMAAQLEKEKKKKRAKKEQKERAPSQTNIESDNNVCIDEECSAAGCHRDEEAMAKKRNEVKLLRMSVTTAIAIALHNFPEGLATFVAALHDPKVGAVLALAIAIHNIPEGLCVALPIYYATGSRWKAFGLALCSGASEPLAALLGWAVLANTLNDTMYAILFGLVGGMMVIIGVRELLPTAHRYDPDDSVVTNSYIAGMCIMALSLVLFLV
jgi:zinc transporter ZupT